MKISVIIPHRGREEQLLSCLGALEEQTMNRDKYEVIVAGHVRKELSESLGPGTRYIKAVGEEEEFSAAAMRNLGIREAEGDVLLFLDCDMLLPEAFLENLRENMKGGSKMLFALRKRLPRGTAPQRAKLKRIKCPRDEREVARAMLNVSYENIETIWLWAYSHTMCVRRKDITELGGFREEFSGWGMEDTELAYRFFREGIPIICDHKSRCYHLWHRESYDRKRQRGYRENIEILRSIYKEPLLEGLDLCFGCFNTAAAAMAGGDMTPSYVCGLCMFEAYARGLYKKGK